MTEKSTILFKNVFFAFKSIEQAKDTLQHHLKSYEYKGIPIYPTIDKDDFYLLRWSVVHSGGDMYDYLVHGTYNSVCREIDRKLEEKKNKKYKRIIKI